MKIKDKINLQPSIKLFNILCCENFKMTEIQIQNGCLQRPDTKYVNEKEPKNLITAKTVLHG